MAAPGECAVCPQRGMQVSPEGSTDVAQCVCRAGTYAAPGSGQCTRCPTGTFKADDSNAGLEACGACPPTMTSADGAASCSCPYGHVVGSSGVCEPVVVCRVGTQLHSTRAGLCVGCPADTYSVESNTSPSACVACPPGTHTAGVVNATSAAQCVCRSGMLSRPGSAACYCEFAVAPRSTLVHINTAMAAALARAAQLFSQVACTMPVCAPQCPG